VAHQPYRVDRHAGRTGCNRRRPAHRDPATKLSASDPGAILVGRTPYQNANDSKTEGLDLEAKQRFDLGGNLAG